MRVKSPAHGALYVLLDVNHILTHWYSSVFVKPIPICNHIKDLKTSIKIYEDKSIKLKAPITLYYRFPVIYYPLELNSQRLNLFIPPQNFCSLLNFFY
jgi:hypothetical protein